MSNSFTKETDSDDDHEDASLLPAGIKNLMTPTGFAALQAEREFLLRKERPAIVEIVSWAAGNGDRSENGDYIYNKKRLRDIDRRIRYLTKKLEDSQIVDPKQQQELEQVFFGATVSYLRNDGTTRTVTLVGVDEADLAVNKINWLSPLARALMKAREGDRVDVRLETGVEEIEVMEIRYIVHQHTAGLNN